VKSSDERRDVASLRIHAGQLQPAAIGDSSRLRAGELVVAVGNPLGFTGALSTGVIHATGPLNGLGRRTWVQAGIRLAPGNSGGPLADALGRVIGINTMVVSGGLALAVPVNTARAFLESGPGVTMGVTVRPVRLPDRRGLGLLILEVGPGSPADDASLRTGDVLTGVGESDFRSLDDLSDAIERNAGQVLAVRFLRGGADRKREVRVSLARKAAA
jgi:serine protease Do